MKKLLLILFLLPMYLTAQEEFSFQLYFEDAVGNRDTLTLGYDLNASNQIDASFGEVNILSQPWANVLDVRIGDKTYETVSNNTNWLSNNTYHTKKQILSSFCDNLNKRSQRVSLQFPLNHLPVKVKWDGTLFENDSCRTHSSLFGEKTDLTTDAFHGTALLHGSGMDSITIDYHTNQQNITKLMTFMWGTQPHYPIQSYIENNDTIGVFQFIFWGEDGSLGINEPNELGKFKIYPNPISDYLQIQKPELFINSPLEIQILTVNGQMLKSIHLNENQSEIDLRDIQEGIYFIIFTDKQRNTKPLRFIKQ
jgi:hypothetical protein